MRRKYFLKKLAGLVYKSKTCLFFFCLMIVCLVGSAQSNKEAKSFPPISVGNDGRLIYAKDSLGNRIPDFSHCGYMAAEHPIPDVPIRIVVPHKKGDATLRIQSALDYVVSLPANSNGIRGAVLLEKGVHEVSGSLRINASGVILRGSGAGTDGTTLLAAGKSRETLIKITGINNRQMGDAIRITDHYVPVNANNFTLVTAQYFKAGDMVIVQRPSTEKWIKNLGTDHFGGGITALGWKPGTRDIFWDRKVLSVEGQTITLDAPLTTALDSTYGGGTVSKYEWQGRIHQVGIENLRMRSAYDKNNPKDEEHSWMAITFENVADAWVRQVVFEHFAGSAVAIFETAKRITVEDCKSLAPISEIGGERRNSFFTNGQQTLFRRCYAEYGYHDFSVGFCAAGPNAFVQCESHLPHSFSGAIDSWASGVLFDIVNVDGNALSFSNRWQDGQGAGWCAANSVFWQCSAARIDCFKPPTANNYSFGSWSQFAGDGYWGESNNHVKPRSLYYGQLKERLEKNSTNSVHLLPLETDASSSPTTQVANSLTGQAIKPAVLLSDWIDQAHTRQPIPVKGVGIKTIDQVGLNKTGPAKAAGTMRVQNGWLVRGTSVVTGNRQQVAWWSGGSRPYALGGMRAHITRFVPGRTGTGLTDDLNEVTDAMKNRNSVAMEYNYALWYDRRRDDHERIRRMDGEVWPPFYEVPFARSGLETAWDGLSKYDLTKYNQWYWSRLKQFADLADQKGLALIYHHYFQHNIIEAGAHYADFAWRPVNNINNTGFPEPVPYAGDKRIFMAEQFYDTTHTVRRNLHRAYIKKSLDNFASNNGVIHLISAEYTGPLHFVQFWLNTIKEWEKETGKNAIVGLSTTRDVQDSILADKDFGTVVDLIDIRYWHYRHDGTLYAPLGGQNLAPRQHARLVSPGKSSFEQVYRAVREYRDKYPGKAIIYSGDSYDQFGWAAFMAGGSMTNVPKTSLEKFFEEASQMKPMQMETPGQWILGKPDVGYIIYNSSRSDVNVDLNESKRTFTVTWIDPENGKELKKETIEGGRKIELKGLNQSPVVIWLSR